MKTLKNWKLVDIWGQIVMLSVPIIFGFLIDNFDIVNNWGYYLIALLSVGAWQVISCLIHLPLMKKIWIARSRVGYNIALLILLIVALLSTVMIYSDRSEAIFYELFALIGIGIILGIWYFCNTVVEYNKIAAMRQNSRYDLLNRINKPE